MLTMFETAAKQAQQRQAQLRQEQEARAAQARAAREQKTAARQAQAEKDRLRHNVARFVDDLSRQVVRVAGFKKWSPEAILTAGEYVSQLVCLNDRELPKVDPSIAAVVHRKFAYGIALNGKIPEGLLLGQRQDWFLAAYEEAVKKIKAKAANGGVHKPQPAGDSATSRVVYTTRSA